MSTSWLVVRALVDESLKKVSRSGDLRRFTDAELRDAAGVDEFEWRNVRTWWMKRRDDAQTFLRSENQDGVLLDMERFPGGGRGITASTGIVVRKPEGALADQREDEEEDAGASGPRGSTLHPDFRPFSESASSARAGLKAATAEVLWWHVCNRLP
jgi:hypothetical protein